MSSKPLNQFYKPNYSSKPVFKPSYNDIQYTNALEEVANKRKQKQLEESKYTKEELESLKQK